MARSGAEKILKTIENVLAGNKNLDNQIQTAYGMKTISLILAFSLDTSLG